MQNFHHSTQSHHRLSSALMAALYRVESLALIGCNDLLLESAKINQRIVHFYEAMQEQITRCVWLCEVMTTGRSTSDQFDQFAPESELNAREEAE